MTEVEAGVTIEHRHPQAGLFVREHGPVTVAVLEDLLCHAKVVDGELVVRASSRELAARLGFLSKDSANRRIRRAVVERLSGAARAGVLVRTPRKGVLCRAPNASGYGFLAPLYVVRLAGTGISVAPVVSRRGRTTSRPGVPEPQRLFAVPETGSRGTRP